MADDPNTRKKRGPQEQAKPGKPDPDKDEMKRSDRQGNQPGQGPNEDMNDIEDEDKVTERHPALGRTEPTD